MIKNIKKNEINTFINRASVPLQYETKEGYIITFGKLLDPDSNQFDVYECAKYLFMTCEVQNIIRGTNEGLVVIVDTAGLTIGHIARMNLMIIRKLLYYIQEAAPVRLKALHILNTMPVVDKLLNIVKPFVKRELLELVSYQHIIHIIHVIFY